MSPVRASVHALMLTKQQVAEGRRLFLERYIEIDPKGEGTISLSGGVDSTTVLFAALECGFKPRCKLFHVKHFQSQDLFAAKQLAKHFGLTLDVVTIDDNIDQLIADCFRLIDEGIAWEYVRTIKPTLFQIPHPYLYVLEKGTSSPLITGNSGDVLAVSHREAAIAYRKGLDPYAVAVRSTGPLEARNAVHIEAMARVRRIKLVDFFESKPIFDWARAITVEDYNHPKPKWGHVAPFLDYWKRGKFYRPSGPYQIVSGIQRLHEQLCKTEHNPRGMRAKTPVTAYRMMVASRGIQVPGSYWTDVARTDRLEPLYVEAKILTPTVAAL